MYLMPSLYPASNNFSDRLWSTARARTVPNSLRKIFQGPPPVVLLSSSLKKIVEWALRLTDMVIPLVPFFQCGYNCSGMVSWSDKANCKSTISSPSVCVKNGIQAERIMACVSSPLCPLRFSNTCTPNVSFLAAQILRGASLFATCRGSKML